MVNHIVALVTRLVRDSPAIDDIILSIELNDTQKFLTHVVPKVPHPRGAQGPRPDGFSHLDKHNHASTLIEAKWVLNQYNYLLWFILDKGSMKRLTIQMEGKLPSMIGALGGRDGGSGSKGLQQLNI